MTRRYWTQADLWRALLPIIEAGVKTDFPGARVARAYQPGMQAKSSGIQVLLHRSGFRRVGAQGKIQERTGGRIFTHETWRREDTFQINAVCPPSTSEDAATPQDVLDALASYLQSAAALDAFRTAGLGILRVNDLREVPVENEQGHYEFSTSFDVVITYTQTKTTETPCTTTIEHKVYRV